MRERVFRISAFLLAAGLIIASALEYRRWYLTRTMLVSLLDEAGIAERYPEIIADVRRQPDTDDARLRAARALLAIEVDREDAGRLPAGGSERSESLERLRHARSLAETVRAARPGSWRAHLIIGAATYLELSRARNPAILANRTAWEEHLLLAHELAPGQSEPPRFLAAAYLSEWSRLDDDSRARALPLLARALRDPRTLDLLLARWLRLAPSLDTALSVLPDRSNAWSKLARYHAGRSDWERYCIAREHLETLLFGELDDDLLEARLRLSRRDPAAARSLLLATLDRMPVRGPFHELLIELLDILPPGPVPPRQAAKLSEWLDWAGQRCLQGQCQLPARAASRLAGLADLPKPASLAEAAVIAEDLPRAELLERRAETLTPDWAPYLLLKAELLLRRGQSEEARLTLEKVTGAWLGTAEYRLLADRLGVAELHSPLIGDWHSSPTRHRTAVAVSDETHALEFIVLPAVKEGGAVDVLWNGRFIACRAVPATVRLALKPLSVFEVNHLELVPLEMLRIRPGEVRLAREAELPTPPRRVL